MHGKRKAFTFTGLKPFRFAVDLCVKLMNMHAIINNLNLEDSHGWLKRYTSNENFSFQIFSHIRCLQHIVSLRMMVINIEGKFLVSLLLIS